MTSGSSKLVWEEVVLMSPGFLLRRRLELRDGLGRVEAREVLLLRMKRDSREKISAGSSSLMMALSAVRWVGSGEASLDLEPGGEGRMLTLQCNVPSPWKLVSSPWRWPSPDCYNCHYVL